VQCPGIFGPDGGICVPELGEEELSTGVDEAAGIGGGGAVMAGERGVDGTGVGVVERAGT
jgi:hypothetical protein